MPNRDTVNVVPFTQEDIRAYLDRCIEYWRERAEEGHNEAAFYIDAYQSVRMSILGETLESRNGINISPELREQMAALEHERWSHWMRYMFGCGVFNEDGTWTMPADKVEHWQRQMDTPYAKLSEREKHSDRAEVEKTLMLLEDNNVVIH